MLKKITFCFLAVLLICSFTIFAFAAEWKAETQGALIESFDGFVGSDFGNVDYKFYAPSGSHVADNDGENMGYNDLYVYIYYDGMDYIWSLWGTLNGRVVSVDPTDANEFVLFGGEVTIVSDDEGANFDDAITLFNSYVADVLTPIEEEPVYTGIFSVFTHITTWIVGALGSIVALFWANGSLTFFGILTLIALGIALFFLLCRLISNFLQFRS